MNLAESSSSDESSWDDDSNLDNLSPIVISPPSPVTPPCLDDFDSDNESESTLDLHAEMEKHYKCLLGAIHALQDEVEQARILNNLEVLMLCAPQLQLLKHFAVFQPHLFRKKL